METTAEKRRRPVMVNTLAHPHYFKPRHCAGETCLHDHAGRSMPLRGKMRLFRSLLERRAA